MQKTDMKYYADTTGADAHTRMSQRSVIQVLTKQENPLNEEKNT